MIITSFWRYSGALIDAGGSPLGNRTQSRCYKDRRLHHRPGPEGGDAGELAALRQPRTISNAMENARILVIISWAAFGEKQRQPEAGWEKYMSLEKKDYLI